MKLLAPYINFIATRPTYTHKRDINFTATRPTYAHNWRRIVFIRSNKYLGSSPNKLPLFDPFCNYYLIFQSSIFNFFFKRWSSILTLIKLGNIRRIAIIKKVKLLLNVHLAISLYNPYLLILRNMWHHSWHINNKPDHGG